MVGVLPAQPAQATVHRAAFRRDLGDVAELVALPADEDPFCE
jgi:hypothetical protein